MAVLVAACPSLASAGALRLVIPQVATQIRCDGELDEHAWLTPARTGPFVDANGGEAAPYSEARFLRDDNFLYLALYAADEDIRSTDEFVVELGSGRARSTLHFTAGGKLTPAITGAQIGVDRDGSIDDATNDDEEWVVEAAIPFAAVPLARDGSTTVRITRCDTTKDHVKRCGSWSGRVVVRR
jgi:hypothetical protein